MNTYSVINQDTKAWWWHLQLREQGKADEARRLERASVRDKIRTIRGTVLMSIGNHGFNIYMIPERDSDGRVSSSSSISGYGDGRVYSESLRSCRPDVPIVDKRTVPIGFISGLVISGPMPAAWPEKADPVGSDGTWGGFHYCPIPVYLAISEAMGATVHWGSCDRQAANQAAQATIVKLKGR